MEKNRFFDRLKKDQTGAVAVMFALLLIPLTFAMGMAVDYGRMVMHEAQLQRALDSAVLAGASKLQGLSNTQAATSAASNYFNVAIGQMGNDITVVPGTPTAYAGKTASGYGSYNVKMSATASFKAAFLPVLGIKSLSLYAYAEAANPLVQPQVTFGPLGSTAADYNALFMYGVPMTGSGGSPDYTKYPPLYNMYEAGSNCSSVDSNYSASSRCNAAFGATPPANNNTVLGTIPSNQPIGFVFVNMNNGLVANGNNGYGQNPYGAQPGYYELMSTAPLSLSTPQSPSSITDGEASLISSQLYPGVNIYQGATSYTKGTGGKNCSVQIQLVTDPSNPPTSPPYPGQCLSPTDTRSGSQYANLSCDQMAGRTFMYWWNDMGGNPDDYNYRDMYYTVKCVAGAVGNNGGTLSNPAPSSGQYLQLIK